MSKRKDKQKRGNAPQAGKETSAAPEAPAAPQIPSVPPEGLKPAPRWILAAGLAAYAIWLAVLIWLAFQPKPTEPLPARIVTNSRYIVVGKAGPEGLAVEKVLKGPSEWAGTTLRLSNSPKQADAAERIHFLKAATFTPDTPVMAAADPDLPSAPADPLLLNQVREILRVEAEQQRAKSASRPASAD